jgi:hypothetical protein
MNYILRNPPLVYRHQSAGRPATYHAERTSKNSRHVRAVVPVYRLVKQLRPYVLQRYSHNCKKHNLINFSNYTNYMNYVNYNHFLEI